MKKHLFLLSFIFFASSFFTACEEKAKPRVIVAPELKGPLSCMRLDRLVEDKELLSTLEKLYSFDEHCPLTLTLSSKKDIVCNSTVNMMRTNMGKFPKSFLKLELREGMKVKYSYYVDLYSNVNEEDVEEGFERLKKDLLMPKGAE